MTVVDLRGWRYDHMADLFLIVGILLVNVSLWIWVFIMLRSIYTGVPDIICGLMKIMKYIIKQNVLR